MKRHTAKAKRQYIRRKPVAPEAGTYGLLIDHFRLTGAINDLSGQRASIAACITERLPAPSP